ncbi:MAG TPA: ROK family protein [Caulifigura sp.]|nr:ROK family protein [Caulifigura sp.]
MKVSSQAARGFEASLIHRLRVQKDVSRAELARSLDAAPSTIGQYVDRLITGGYLKEGRKAVLPSGRWPTVLELNPGVGRFVGIDFEARQMVATAVDFAQHPVEHCQKTILASDTVDQVIEKIVEAVREVSVQGVPLLGVGIGVPGVVDAARGIAVHYSFLRGWTDVPLVSRLQERLTVPVFLENNIRAMALAEQLFGQGRGTDNFLCIGIRSGIGAGVVVNGQLHRGPGNVAGEIGAWPLEHGKTLEGVASLSALSEQLVDAIRGGEPSSLTIRRNRISVDDLIAAARDGDGLVVDAIWQAGQVIGKAIAQMCLLLNPGKVILAGPLGQLELAFVQSVREAVQHYSRPPQAVSPLIAGSELGAFGGALGGAALVAQNWEPPGSGSPARMN